jgi:hypothetical protein
MSSKARIFYPKTRLSELAARAGGIPADIAVEEAMKCLDSMRPKGDAEIMGAIAAIEAALPGTGEELSGAQMLKILRHADLVVTLAGTFGYADLDCAARSLCDVADGLRRAGMSDVKPIAVHIQAMRLMAPGTALSRQHAAVMLEQLAKVAAHFSFGSLDAAADDADEAVVAAAK